MDHIVPVIEGGGGCGLDNLRTLCRKCHVEETAALRKRMAAKRQITSQTTAQEEPANATH
jgi:5-methylcytosine-specific restriction endonuclease McrA